MGALPDSGEDNDWFVRKRLRSYADAGSYVEDQNVKDILSLIAASNQQAVQKARLEEAKHFEHNISQFYDVNGSALDEIKQFARYRVEDLQRLAAAQPRKDGDEKSTEEIKFLERLMLEFNANKAEYAGEPWSGSDAAVMVKDRLAILQLQLGSEEK